MEGVATGRAAIENELQVARLAASARSERDVVSIATQLGLEGASFVGRTFLERVSVVREGDRVAGFGQRHRSVIQGSRRNGSSSAATTIPSVIIIISAPRHKGRHAAKSKNAHDIP